MRSRWSTRVSKHVKKIAVIDDESMIEAIANSLRWRIIDRNGLDHNSLTRASNLFEFFSHESRSIKFHNRWVYYFACTISI